MIKVILPANIEPQLKFILERAFDDIGRQFNALNRLVRGVDTTDDLIVDLATKGLVLKDTQGTPHYWRITVNNTGVLVISDLGTTKP